MLADTVVLNPDLSGRGPVGPLLALWSSIVCAEKHIYIFTDGGVLERRSRRSGITRVLSLLSGDTRACFYTFLLNKEAA